MKTTRACQLPLFYSHPIGSLPRPKTVLDLLSRRSEIAPERFRASMDDS